MDITLDHVFILVEPEAKIADRLIQHGFRQGPKKLTHAQQNLEHRCKTLDLRCSDIWHFPFVDNAFDVVIFAHVLEHMANPVETLREIVRVLKPGAPLIGSVTRKGLGQILLSLRWQNRGYASSQPKSPDISSRGF